MCVARYASHYFSKGAICVPLDDQEKNICTMSSHRATRELYTKVPSHRAPVGAVCEGSMRIELRSELYAMGALCGSTELFIRLTASVFRKLPSVYVFSYFPFGFEGGVRDLIVSDHCLSFYLNTSTMLNSVSLYHKPHNLKSIKKI